MFDTPTSLKKGKIVTKLYRINIYVKRLEYARLVLTKIVSIPFLSRETCKVSFNYIDKFV